MGVQPEAITWPETDLTFCEREPIHIPGAIQPHGALLAVLADGFVVTHASANLASFFGPPADAAAGVVLADIRKLGVEVAIDDFGIGYSSLSYLLRLPIDQVKLDRSFLEDIEGDPRGMGFASAVVALAHSAGKPVVFEGIETDAQFNVARDTGADLVQGFLFAPPLSFNAALELVVRQRRLDEQP